MPAASHGKPEHDGGKVMSLNAIEPKAATMRPRTIANSGKVAAWMSVFPI
jgi:hypothetical protein